MCPRDTVSGGGNPPMGVGSPNVCIATRGAPGRGHVAPRHAQTRAARQEKTGQCRHAATAGGETPGTHSAGLARHCAVCGAGPLTRKARQGLCAGCAQRARWQRGPRGVCEGCGTRVRGLTRTGLCCACAAVRAPVDAELSMMLDMAARGAVAPGPGRPQRWCATEGCAGVGWADTAHGMCRPCARRWGSRLGNAALAAQGRARVCRVCGAGTSRGYDRCLSCAARAREGRGDELRRREYLVSPANLARLHRMQAAFKRRRAQAVAQAVLSLPAGKRADFCWLRRKRPNLYGATGALRAVGRPDLAEALPGRWGRA